LGKLLLLLWLWWWCADDNAVVVVDDSAVVVVILWLSLWLSCGCLFEEDALTLLFSFCHHQPPPTTTTTTTTHHHHRGVICFMGIIYESGPIQNFIAFFICGLPGGLDYLMLFGVKQGYFEKLDEKQWNARINVWVRSPGLMACCCFLYIAALYGPAESLCSSNKPVLFIAGILVFLNGQYYMQVVVGNTFRKVTSYSS
jgi:hypothetical protein